MAATNPVHELVNAVYLSDSRRLLVTLIRLGRLLVELLPEPLLDYVRYNPAKHGLVAEVRDWRYSTFHRYIRLGLYLQDWAGTALPRTEGGHGEPGE